MEDPWPRMAGMLSVLEAKGRSLTSTLNNVIKRIKAQADNWHSDEDRSQDAHVELESTIDSTTAAFSKEEEKWTEWLRQNGELDTSPSTLDSCETTALTQDNVSDPQATQGFEKSMEDRMASLEKSVSDHVTANQSLESSLRTALVMLASAKQSSKGHQLESRVSQLEALTDGAKSSDQAVDGTSKDVAAVQAETPGGATGGAVAGRPEFRRSTESHFRRSALPGVRRAAFLRHSENTDTEIHVTPVIDQERDLRQYEENCPHKDRHGQFLEIEQFSLNDLPEEFKDDILLENCVMHGLASLSARIKVKSTSAKRPATFPDSTRNYPFCWINGEEMTRVGSGRVRSVNYVSEKEGWDIRIATAAHLVYNESEAKESEIDLIVRGRRHTLKVGKWVTVRDSVWRDVSELSCNIMDGELGKQLQSLVTNTIQSMEKLDKMHTRKNVEGGLVFMLCHPHGAVRAKISLGTAKSLETEERDGTKYARLCFTAASCVGCSGAMVWPVGFEHLDWTSIMGVPCSGRNCQGDLVTGWRW